MRPLFRLFASLSGHAGLVLSMAMQQVRRRYVETVGGIAWSLIQPLIMIATLWFVFSVGFKTRIGDGSVSFTAYFVTGSAAWFLISEGLMGSVGAVVGNAHLVKKVVFPIEALPVAPIITSAIGNVALLAIVCLYLVFDRGGLPWTALQLPYYALCAMTLSGGLGLLCAALQVFFRDVQRIVESVVSIWFWLTPIVWPVDKLPAAYRAWMDLNPAYYVVNGYRDSLIHGVPFWRDGMAAAAFWIICIALLAVGAWVFERLKPDFAEVM